MKFFHLSDLHFGKLLHGYDLSEEQRGFISFLKDSIQKEKPDAILIAGDIYDKSVPSASAMTLLDELLMNVDGTPVLIIAGNHDSAERLKYGQKFLETHKIYISVMPPQSSEEQLRKISFDDEFGTVNFYMLPFIKSGFVRHFMPEEAQKGEQAIIQSILNDENVNLNERNVILSHQFYVNCGNKPDTCDSEQMPFMVGGTDSVDISVLANFDYAALGHIHGAQSVGEERFRYCGTALKFSISEEKHEKSITVVEIGKKENGHCNLDIHLIPIKAERDVRKIKGDLESVIAAAKKEHVKDYVSITLTDEVVPDNVKDSLNVYYDNILEIIVDNQRTRKILEEEPDRVREMTPYEAFEAFFEETSGRKMNEKESGVIQEIIKELE